MQLPPDQATTVTLGAGAQIAMKLIEQLPQILTSFGVILTAALGFYNARKITQVKTQTDGHFTQLTAALAASMPASAIPVAPTIVLPAVPLVNGPSVAGGRRADDTAAEDVKGKPDGVR